MDNYWDEKLEYFCNQIFSHKDFRFLIVYGLIVRIKVNQGKYYTLFKGQRHLCVKDTLDFKHLDILFNDIPIRFDEILNKNYPEVISSYPEGIVIDFFSLKALNSDDEYNKYINNVSQLSDIKDTIRVKSIKRFFAIFGGYSSGIRMIEGFSTNIFEGKFIPNMH